MIRSSKTTIKFSNQEKLDNLHSVLAEYKLVVTYFIKELWTLEKIPNLLPKELTKNCNTWVSARLVQCAGKQASGIVRGTLQKQKQRLYIISKLRKEGKGSQADKLQNIYDNASITIPDLKSLEMELDSRFVKFDLDNSTSFDGWLNLSSLGEKLKISLPFKKNRHFNKLLKAGKLKSGVRISDKEITFMFDIQDIKIKTKGKSIGIDIGKTTMLSVSNGVTSKKDNHNHDLNSIISRLAKRKKGSKGFQRAQEHRKNYINWSVNQLNFTGVKEVKIENIKNLRKGKTINRSLSHWTYTDIFEKLKSYCEEQGVLVTRVNPAYTSQKCSACGSIARENRSGKLFKCTECNFTQDADLNASKNISLSEAYSL